MERWLTYAIAVVFIACISCSKRLDLPEVQRERKITLLGELVANDPIYFRGGQSIAVSAGSSLKFELLHDLSVTITDNTGLNLSLAGNEDTLSKYLFTVPFSSATAAKPGNSYHITATHPTLGTVSTDVSVPGAFTASVSGTADALYGTDTTLAVDLVINDQPGDHYYVIEAVKQKMNIAGRFLYNAHWWSIADSRVLYDSLKAAGIILQKEFDTTFASTYLRQNLYTNDANTENTKDGNSFVSFRRVLLGDYTFQGSAYTTRVYISKAQYLGPDTTFEKGRVLLQVKSVSKDYFDYLKVYELHYPNSDLSSFSSPVSLSSPVKGGMGIIGGVYKQQFVFILDKWEF